MKGDSFSFGFTLRDGKGTSCIDLESKGLKASGEEVGPGEWGNWGKDLLTAQEIGNVETQVELGR